LLFFAPGNTILIVKTTNPVACCDGISVKIDSFFTGRAGILFPAGEVQALISIRGDMSNPADRYSFVGGRAFFLII
jgi:hypothetical protein